MMFHNFGYGMGWWGIPIMFLFWAGLILLVAWVVRGLISSASRTGGTQTGNPEPQDIADRRYASGEITRKEYLQIKKDLAS